MCSQSWKSMFQHVGNCVGFQLKQMLRKLTLRITYKRDRTVDISVNSH